MNIMNIVIITMTMNMITNTNMITNMGMRMAMIIRTITLPRQTSVR